MNRPSRLPALARVIARRGLSGVLVMWGAATLTFLGLHATKGDIALVLLGGPEANPTPQAVAAVNAEYGFSKPLWTQYGIYFDRLLHGNLGYSYQQHESVVHAIALQLSPTVQLAFASAVAAVVIALAVSLATAGRSRAVGSAVSGAATLFASMPGFVLGIGLLFAFAAAIPIFPSAGNEGPRYLVLPTLALALPISAHLIQVLRPELDEVLEQPFILTARIRGMGVVAVKLRHALRHALVPIATMTGFVIAGLLGGAVLIETVFSRQGLGRLAATAVENQDLPLVLGVVIFAALVFVVVNLIVDVVYSIIDPRLATV